MKLISVNIGTPQDVAWKGKMINTAIFKKPIEHALEVKNNKIEGDQPANPKYHGGPDKAVYAYSATHYAYWQETLGREDLTWGIFGENLTIEGDFFETAIQIGDVFEIGSVRLMAVQPRMPCAKLGLRFQDALMVKKFYGALKNGVYFRIVQEGSLQKGDEVHLVAPSEAPGSIYEAAQVLNKSVKDPQLIQKLLDNPNLPKNLEKHFHELLNDVK